MRSRFPSRLECGWYITQSRAWSIQSLFYRRSGCATLYLLTLLSTSSGFVFYHFTMGTNDGIAKKVLVSGGTGFVGSAIVRALADKHPRCAITIIDRSAPRPQHALPEKISFVQVNITAAEEVHQAFEIVQPDVVIHTAGIVPALADRFGRRLEREVWKTNVVGTQNMLDAAAKSGAQAFIYTSTCCVVTDDMSRPYHNVDESWPTSPSSLIYGESKVVTSGFPTSMINPTPTE